MNQILNYPEVYQLYQMGYQIDVLDSQLPLLEVLELHPFDYQYKVIGKRQISFMDASLKCLEYKRNYKSVDGNLTLIPFNDLRIKLKLGKFEIVTLSKKTLTSKYEICEEKE